MIKQVNFNTIDVFLGKGWDFWGRFKIAHKQDKTHLYQIAGTRFPNQEVEKLHNLYNSK